MKQIKLEKYYDVCCDICGRHMSTDFYMGMETTPRLARLLAKKVGYRMTKNEKTVCPICCKKYVNDQNYCL